MVPGDPRIVAPNATTFRGSGQGEVVARATQRTRKGKGPVYSADPVNKTEAQLRARRREIGQRVDRLRHERGVTVKSLSQDIGWDEKSQYSRKSRGLTPFSIEELDQLAAILKAPRGWPYVPTEEAMLLQALGQRAGEVLAHLPEILKVISPTHK